jgi:uncharacterized damage-inducible protein DinB
MTANELKEELGLVRERLLQAIAGVTEEQFKRRPASGEGEAAWSIAEVLAHLLATHRLRAERIAIALDRDGAEIEPSAPDAHETRARAGRAAPVPQLIHGLLASWREIERLIDRAAETERGLDRAVLHPQQGRQTVAWMAREKIIDHEREHTLQIEALRDVIGAAPLGRLQ